MGNRLGMIREWNLYIGFLMDWIETHANDTHYGMSPPSFDEFLDNEFQESEEEEEENCACPKGVHYITD